MHALLRPAVQLMSMDGLDVTTLEARLIAAGVPSVVSYLRGFMTRGTLTPVECDRAVDIFYEWGRTYLTFTNHWSYRVLLEPDVRGADVRPRLIKHLGLPNDLVIIVCHFLFPSIQHHMIRRWTSSYATVRRHNPLRINGPLPLRTELWLVSGRSTDAMQLLDAPAGGDVPCHAELSGRNASEVGSEAVRCQRWCRSLVVWRRTPGQTSCIAPSWGASIRRPVNSPWKWAWWVISRRCSSSPYERSGAARRPRWGGPTSKIIKSGNYRPAPF